MVDQVKIVQPGDLEVAGEPLKRDRLDQEIAAETEETGLLIQLQDQT
jgi:hypothetical protein|tara:strand:+ start:621 stop:761 length:141 start_codon:yes stop_codon:yes gene_type:complete